jgi:hypothetical protein
MSRHEMLGSVLDLGSRIGMPFLIIRSTSLGWAAFVTGSSAISLQAPSHFFGGSSVLASAARR